MRGKSGKKAAKAEKKEIAKANTRNIFLLLLVVGVVAVSGCIFGGGGSVSTGGNGVVINDFTLSASDVSDCDKSVRASLELENSGGNSIPSGELMACINGENFPGKTSEQMWAIDSAQADKVCQASAKKLDAPDTVKNIPGGAASFRWTLFSPFVPFPLTRSDDFEGRIFYKYGSRTSAKIFIISESELAVAKQRGEALPSAPEIDKTSSPVDISVDVSQPIVGARGDTFTLKVTLSNVGGGTVFDRNAITFEKKQQVPSIPEDDLNLITVDVDTPLDEGGASEAGFCGNELKNVELRRGSTVTIPCDIRINSDITKLQSFPVLLTASFGYFVDSGKVPIAVSGKKNKDPATGCNKGVSSGTAQPSVPAPPGADTAAPTITNTVPFDGQQNFPRAGNIVITFSEAMSQEVTKTATDLFEVRADGTIDNTARQVEKSFNAEGNELTLDPAQILGGNNRFVVIVTTGAKDSAGNNLATEKRVFFKTAN